jgi:chaperonin GroEL
MNQFQETTTQVIFASDARKKLYEGVQIAADVIGCTLGPKGKTVIIQRPGQAPLVSKDGVTVSKSIRLKDPVKRMGADLVREAANQTNEVAGDGTTTASVLTQALVKEGMKLVEAGLSSLAVCRGINTTVELVMDELKKSAVPIKTSDEITQIGTISANGDGVIGGLIAEAMDRVGRDGIITVEDAKGMSTSMEVVEGMQLDRGYVSPYFITDPERMRAVYENAFVLVTDKKLSNFKDIIPALESVVKAQRSLLIIAEDFEGDAMTGLVLNRVKSQLPVVAVKAPGYGQHRQELLADICVLTGATLISSANGLSLDKVIGTQLGQLKRFVSDAKVTTLVGPGTTKDAVMNHIEQLRVQAQDITLSQDELTKLRMRAAKLASGVAVIRVGGATEIEMQEKKFRVEDALNATKAAVEEGIVPGGGMALFNAVQKVRKAIGNAAGVDPDEMAGAKSVFVACLSPLQKIVSNAGQSAAVVVATLEREAKLAPLDVDNRGYNAATGEYEDLVAAGVIDPVKVTRSALKNAVSVATTFLSLDAVVYDEPTKEETDAQ